MSAYNKQPLGHSGIYSLQVHGGGHIIRPDFTLIEFVSKCGCDQVLVHPVLADFLQELREEFDQVVRLNSAYRSFRHNLAVGGRQPGVERATGSLHLYGLAADVDVLQVTPKKVADWAESKNVGGCGRYKTFTHVDVFGLNRRWGSN